MNRITSLSEAAEFVLETIEAHPQRDLRAATEAALTGAERAFPAVTIHHLVWPDDTHVPADELELPEISIPDGPEAELARETISMLEPLKMCNPIQALFSTGVGPGTLVPSFGIPLNPDACNSAARTRALTEVLADNPPDPADSGLLAGIRERIEFIKACTPDAMKVGRPDAQGPFNLAHAIIGQEAFTAPHDAPEAFAELMARITDFLIGVIRTVDSWIGPQRRRPMDALTRICECSANLVSSEFYVDHVLPHDLRFARELGAMDVHTCSGPHVFYATLNHLPNIAAIEAGFIECAVAGWTTVDEALEAIGDRPITMRIGQELPPGKEWETIRRDLDRYARHRRLLFTYTAMTWSRRDRPRIRALHEKVDEYWRATYT